MKKETLSLLIATDVYHLLKDATETIEEYEKKRKESRAALSEEIKKTNEWFEEMDKTIYPNPQ